MTTWLDEPRTISRWAGKLDSRTELAVMTPREIRTWFSNPCESRPKDRLPGWSACTCNGKRSSDNVSELAAFVVDADGVPVTLAEAIEALPCFAAGHTSASHGTKPGNSWRAMVWPDRSLSPEEYRACWPVVVDLFAGMGVDVDRKCSDLARLWFVPMAGPHYEHGANDRAPLPVAKLLELVKREELASDVSTRAHVAPPASSHSRPVAERVEAYLARVEPAVSGSNGSTVTLNTAIKLIRVFGVDATGAYDALIAYYNGRCVPPWQPRELLRKCQEAERIVHGRAAS